MIFYFSRLAFIFYLKPKTVVIFSSFLPFLFTKLDGLLDAYRYRNKKFPHSHP